MSKERTVIQLLKDAEKAWSLVPYMHKKTSEGWVGDTFKDVDDKSDMIAAFLKTKMQLPENTKVVLIAEGRPEWVEAEYGIMKAKCISVPLSVKLSIPEIIFRIDHSEADAIIFSSNTAIKVHEAMKSVKKHLVGIFIDEKADFIEARTREVGYTFGTDVFYLEDVLKEGAEAIKNTPNLISDIVNSIKEDDVCAISYTSGTSGNPKGVMLMHKNYYTNAHAAAELFPFAKLDYTSLVILPTDHAFAHTVVLYHSLLRGVPIYFTDARKGNSSMLKNFPINLKEIEPKYILVVPAIMQNFYKKIRSSIRQKSPFVQKVFQRGIEAGSKIIGDGFTKGKNISLKERFDYALAEKLVFPVIRKTMGNPKLIVAGGAALDMKLQKFFVAMGINLVQGYGMTETGPIISACTSYLPNKNKFGTVGQIAPFVECKILGENGEALPNGQKGDITVHGDSVMKGYYKNQEATDEVLKDGWMTTGDMGYIDEDGFLVISGRSKALLVSTEGEKHSPEEVESEISDKSLLINQIILYNNENPYTIGLLTLDEEQVNSKIKEKGIKDENELYTYVMEDLNTYTKTTSVNVMWQPAVFVITGHEWTEREGYINSTMKIVRTKVAKGFEDRIKEAHTSQKDAEASNKKVLKELFFTK